VETGAGIERLDQMEAMRHHALVRLPALPRHKAEERVRPLAPSKQEIEELVDERVVRRQRESAQHRARHLLDQALLDMREVVANTIHACVAEVVRPDVMDANSLIAADNRTAERGNGIATQQGEQPDQAIVVAEIFSIERQDRALQEVVSRLNIEPGVKSVSWQRT